MIYSRQVNPIISSSDLTKDNRGDKSNWPIRLCLRFSDLADFYFYFIIYKIDVFNITAMGGDWGGQQAADAGDDPGAGGAEGDQVCDGGRQEQGQSQAASQAPQGAHTLLQASSLNVLSDIEKREKKEVNDKLNEMEGELKVNF